MGKAGNGNTFELHSSFGIRTSGMALVSSSILVCADSASNSAICRRISAISRSRDSRDLNSGRDQVPAQIKGVCNRLQHGWTMTPAKSPGVHSDGEAHRPVGGEQFVPTGLVEFHAMPARPYLRISAFGIHDLFRRVIGNYSWPKRRTGESETLSGENDAPRKIARLLLSPSEQAQTEPVRLGT